MLSALMVQDSLTGLLKHTMIKEQLVQELSREQRTQSALSFAMIDIDKFKLVNDHYGHMMGDRVIKSLARLLKQRLRKSDSIGRYGGEEFAVVLPNCDPDSAAMLLNKIRADFSELRFLHEGKEFSVTFSTGIAGFPAHENADELNQAADEALYEAKHQGRNRIVVKAKQKHVDAIA
jgi:diguanylate cyclase (GGDEF)-like protein